MADESNQRRPAAVTPASPADRATLARLNAIIGEPARPDHVFRWLTVPGGGESDWLPVDAYYPAARLIVECPRENADDPDRERRARLAAENGLRHVALTPQELARPDHELRARLAPRPRLDQPLLPRPVGSGDGAWRPPPAGDGDDQGDRAADGDGDDGAASGGAARLSAVGARVEAVLADQRPEVSGLELGIALTAIAVIELFAAVSVLLASTGASLLALGLTLDAAARIVSVLSALSARERRRAWTCTLVGSPAVVVFVLARPRGAPIATTDAAAGALAIAAILSLLGALLASAT